MELYEWLRKWNTIFELLRLSTNETQDVEKFSTGLSTVNWDVEIRTAVSVHTRREFPLTRSRMTILYSLCPLMLWKGISDNSDKRTISQLFEKIVAGSRFKYEQRRLCCKQRLWLYERMICEVRYKQCQRVRCNKQNIKLWIFYEFDSIEMQWY